MLIRIKHLCVRAYTEYTTSTFAKPIIILDAGMWRYHANRMDARRSQFDLGRVVAYI